MRRSACATLGLGHKLVQGRLLFLLFFFQNTQLQQDTQCGKARFVRETMAIGERGLRAEGADGWVVCDALAAAVAVYPMGVAALRRCSGVGVVWQDPATRGSMTMSGGVRVDVELIDVFEMPAFQRLMSRIIDD